MRDSGRFPVSSEQSLAQEGGYRGSLLEVLQRVRQRFSGWGVSMSTPVSF